FTAVGSDERVALIDRYLAGHPNDVIILEAKRDSRSWDAWKRDLDHIEFMRVGTAGRCGAAEYVRGGLRCAEPVVRATYNPTPLISQPRVPYDSCVRQYFPPDTVISIDQVRRLMLDFALHGEWSSAVPWRLYDHMVV
ncbi:MAG: Imm1 family immunity protein, partial [Pseudonocardiaceae bacterium]